MKTIKIISAIILLVLSYQTVNARTINVPTDSSTIQKGINGAFNGDTVLVAPGNYVENIDFSKKKITVASRLILFPQDTAIISQTIIQPATDGSIVTFKREEDEDAIICGFTIANGYGSVGGGIYCDSTNPQILNNKIMGNEWDQEGGGIYCVDRAHPTIIGNFIADNSAPYGGGIYCDVNCDPYIKNNVVVGNWAQTGGGIYCVQSSPIIVNNTIDSNYVTMTEKSVGGGIAILGPNASPEIRNNIITNTSYNCGIYALLSSPHISYNDVWNNGPGGSNNFCGCPEGVGDTTWEWNFNRTPCDSFFNIIRDPCFDPDSGNYFLSCSSVCIDGGDSTFLPLAVGGAKIDMGAIEYPYILGDANGNGSIGVEDIIFLCNYLFVGGEAPCPWRAGDATCDGTINIADVVYLCSYLFGGGDPPYCYRCKSERINHVDGFQPLNKRTNLGRVGFTSPAPLLDGVIELSITGEFDIEISAIDLEIGYDPDKIELLNPELADMTKGLQIYYGFRDGLLKIGIIDIYGEHSISPGEGALITLRLKGTDISSLKISKAILVDQNTNAFLANVVEKFETATSLPDQYSLHQNFPNPFNPETQISYDLPKDSWVKLSIYNIRGQKVRTLVDGVEAAGHKTVIWDGTNEEGDQGASGVYFYRLEAEEFTATKKMVMVR